MYVEDVEDGKRTYKHIFATFATFLIFNQFSIRKKRFGKLRLRAFQTYYQILCTLKHVEDVKDRSSTLKGCNAMYVEDVEPAFMQHCIQSYSFCYSCLRCQRCQILRIIDQRLKIHTNMSLLITSLIFNRFAIQKKFWKAQT